MAGSREIEDKLWPNPTARAHAVDLPDANTLRRVRRLTREVLQAALEKALREIRRACIQLALSQSLPGAEAPKEVSKPGPAVSSSSTPGEGTTVIMRRDAVQRLENATLCDMEE